MKMARKNSHPLAPPVATGTKSNHKHHSHRNHQNGTTATTSTRVCVKNIPASFTSQHLREFLTKEYVARQATSHNNNNNISHHSKAERLIITDCRVLLDKKTQASRRIAFCGFQTTAMAARVMELFHATFCRTSRLTVEPAAAKPTVQELAVTSGGKQDEKGPGTATRLPTPVNNDNNKKKDDVRNALMELSSTKDKSKFWSNDLTTSTVPSPKVIPPNNDKMPRPSKDESDTDGNRRDKDSDSGSDSDSSDDEADPLANKTIDTRRVMTDLEFLQSKQTKVDNLDDDSASDRDSVSDGDEQKGATQDSKEKNDSDSSSDSDSDDTASQDSASPSKEHKKQVTPDTTQEIEQDKMEEEANNNLDEGHDEADGDKQPAVASKRLFVRNLPFSTTEEQLEEYFAAVGPVSECHIPVDDRKTSKGFAFVTMENHQDASHALEVLDGSDFQGRYLHILPSRQKPKEKHQENEDNTDHNDRPLTYKERQELTRKQEAAKSTKGWSASFVRGEAVIDSLADRLGLKKGDILNVKEGLSSGDAAVRLALGETQVIEENREYFKKHGVDMESLVSAKPTNTGKDGIKRSTTSILVKNLPYDTQVEELAKIFNGVGDAPKHILLPPSRTIALVEYGHASDAKRAFRKLAYRRFKSVPLYFEWAPMEAIGATSATTIEDAMERPSRTKEVLQEEETEQEEQAMEGPTASIYIKNLNFSTTEDKLFELFDKQVGDVRAVKIPKKIAPVSNSSSKSDGEEMRSFSMGFGFVEFTSQAAVQKALKQLQGTFLDGHALELKPSTKSLTESPSTKATSIKPPKTKNPTKLMVRNVPFQATRTELLKLFGSFGQLKRVRLPKKFDGGHRGFAFVEFVTHKEALAGMKALSQTHLYGRHLVLEWAEDETEDPDTGLDAFRQKAQKDVLHHRGHDRERGKSKRQRLS